MFVQERKKKGAATDRQTDRPSTNHKESSSTPGANMTSESCGARRGKLRRQAHLLKEVKLKVMQWKAGGQAPALFQLQAYELHMTQSWRMLQQNKKASDGGKVRGTGTNMSQTKNGKGNNMDNNQDKSTLQKNYLYQWFIKTFSSLNPLNSFIWADDQGILLSCSYTGESVNRQQLWLENGGCVWFSIPYSELLPSHIIHSRHTQLLRLRNTSFLRPCSSVLTYPKPWELNAKSSHKKMGK